MGYDIYAGYPAHWFGAGSGNGLLNGAVEVWTANPDVKFHSQINAGLNSNTDSNLAYGTGAPADGGHIYLTGLESYDNSLFTAASSILAGWAQAGQDCAWAAWYLDTPAEGEVTGSTGFSIQDPNAGPPVDGFVQSPTPPVSGASSVTSGIPGADGGFPTATSGDNPFTPGVWHLIGGVWKHATGQIGVNCDAGAFTYITPGEGNGSPDDNNVGSFSYGGGTLAATLMSLGTCMCWRGAIPNWTALYNGGAGVPFPQWTRN